jgi:hypothetical protein
MRDYKDLQSVDPAWPELQDAAQKSGRVRILPRNDQAARSCLEKLQVTTRSTLGALAHETGGLLIDHRWLRLLASMGSMPACCFNGGTPWPTEKKKGWSQVRTWFLRAN